MISFRLPKTGLVCATLAILAGGASQAQADNLFDMLFGGGNRAASNARVEPMRGVAPAKPVRRKPARVATPKISAPSYYNYKPAEPVHIDFARIAPAVPEAAFGSMLVGAAFRESLPDLAGFELFAEKGIAEALIEYYSKNPDFIWVSGHQANARAEQALRVLAEAGQFGLSEADYTVGVPSTDFQHDQIAERQKQLIRFEMTLSARVLRYARDAYQGRIDPNKLSGYHDLPEKPLDLTQSLGFMARVSDVDIYLKLQHPQNSDYRALRAELETLRAGAEREIVVDPKTFVRPGGSNPEFAKLLKIDRTSRNSPG